MAAIGTRLLVFIDDVTVYTASRGDCEVLSNAAKLFMVQMDNEPRHCVKAIREFLKAKKWAKPVT